MMLVITSPHSNRKVTKTLAFMVLEGAMQAAGEKSHHSPVNPLSYNKIKPGTVCLLCDSGMHITGDNQLLFNGIRGYTSGRNSCLVP